MLDYSMSKYEEKNFILYYEEDGDYFKVYCANGDDYPVPNDKENEGKLLKQMEMQVEAADSFYDKQEKERKSSRNWLIYDIFFLILDTVLMCVNPTVITGFCIGCFVIPTTFNSIKYSICKKKMDDV